MPRHKHTDRPIKITINVPESLYSKVELELYSELENRVPYGAWSSLYSNLLREWLVSKGVVI